MDGGQRRARLITRPLPSGCRSLRGVGLPQTDWPCLFLVLLVRCLGDR